MIKKRPVKIIKRVERERLAQPAAVVETAAAAETAPPRDEKREMISTIAGWVRDHRQQRDGELRSFRRLFRDPLPQPSGG